MLPLDKNWYRKLIILTPIFGVAGALFALGYSSIQTKAAELVFGDPTIDPWTGDWWWIPFTALGAVAIVYLRKSWKVPQKVPGAIAMAKQGWVEPSSALSLVLISLISLIVGASLGPSFGIVAAGGGFGAWLTKHLADKDDVEAKNEFTLTGMSGSLGALFSAPIFGAILGSELSPTSKKNYITAFIPQLLAATVGFAVFFGVTGKVMLGSFSLPRYEYEPVHLLIGVGLGLVSVVLVLIYAVIGRVAEKFVAKFSNKYLAGLLGGAIIGLIAFALPLTAASGSSQLSFVTQNYGVFGASLLVLIVLGKMMAVALSQATGFLGGTVFPLIFIGGTAGLMMHVIFPDIPVALAVGSMIAAMPGAVIAAPVSFVLIAAGGVGIGAGATAPIGVAVIVAYLGMSTFKYKRMKNVQNIA